MRIIDCEQGTPEWIENRHGVITGTRLEQAFKGSQALMNILIAERMTSFSEIQVSSKDMERGNDLEPFARKEYEKITGEIVEEIGFILHPTRDDIGLSPDGIMQDGSLAAEFKCPKSHTHIEYMRSNAGVKKYLFQLLDYFLCIPELEVIDFVSYDEMNEIKPICIKSVTLKDLLTIEYNKGKTVENMSKLEDKVFSFADSVESEYNKLIF